MGAGLIDTIISAFVTVAAAFAGSWSAFKLEDRARSRRSLRDQVAAINRAQFALIRQFTELRTIQTQVIEPKREDPLRCVSMRPSLPFGQGTMRLDVTDVLFLLETEDRDLPFQLMREDARFEAAIQAVNDRSRLHIDQLQPRLAEAGANEESSWSMESLTESLGDEMVMRLQRATDAAINEVDRTVASSAALIDAFHRRMKARFPTDSIIRVAVESGA